MTQSSDRRHRSDRRTEPTASRRTAPPSQLKKWLGIAGRDLAIIVTTVLAIVFSVRSMNPIFANSPTVVQSLTKAARETMVIVYGFAVMLLIAAAIEAFWSSARGIPLPFKYSVAAVCWIAVLGYLGFQGRRED